jgi:hypothetical protein
VSIQGFPGNEEESSACSLSLQHHTHMIALDRQKLRNLPRLEMFGVTRVDLVQLFRFVVVKLIYSGLNPRFDVDAIFMANYFFPSTVRHSW